uniref:Uncharacterized protein n=1 Tax=Anguilla anguilla TaxID=7936 RepID=A0A0E9XV77_ANGAN
MELWLEVRLVHSNAFSVNMLLVIFPCTY